MMDNRHHKNKAYKVSSIRPNFSLLVSNSNFLK